MKKLVISILALLIAIPAVSFAAQVAVPPTDDTPDGDTGSGYFCPNISQTLRRGMRDNTTVPAGQVTELQNFLADYFELDDEVAISGFFGRTTQKYLVEFQSKHGLPAFGIAGTLTRAKIAEICKNGTQPTEPRDCPIYNRPICGSGEVLKTETDSLGCKVPKCVRDNPVACTMEYAPVCGKPAYCMRANMMYSRECEIGKTYSNKCMLKGDGAEFMHEGECGGGVISCPTYQMPRCADGEEVVKGEKLSNGCFGAPYCKRKVPVACTREYVPVCAKPKYCMTSDRLTGVGMQECDNGRTYSNKCVMEAEGAQYMYSSACKTDGFACPVYNMPRCENGATPVAGGKDSRGCDLPPQCQGPVSKCGINTFSVKGNRCDGGLLNGSASGAAASVAIIAPNPEPSYTAAYFQCYDGYSETMGEGSSCKPVSVWQKYAQEKCASRCNTIIPVSGSTQGGSPYESFIWVVNSLREMGR